MTEQSSKARSCAASSSVASLDFAFFRCLWKFHQANHAAIRQSYTEVTRKFLDFNNPETNAKAFLRPPQFEALEIYIFLKEFLGNLQVGEVFKAWSERTGKFGSLLDVTTGLEMLPVWQIDELELNSREVLLERMRKNSRAYPNYIFALAMGTGKTVLIATCIFYEFLLANKFERNACYCHNALVFAPDRTVLQSLKEIESFDLMRVVPPQYVSFLTAHLRFHYLDEAGTSLDTLDGSRFNVIVSNAQKIILKRQRRQKMPADGLFGTTTGLHGVAVPEEADELTTNQRFEKLQRLRQVGIYVDEAHHSFGNALAKDMGAGARSTDRSLRTTIDILAAKLNAAGTRVVACYNYTGTPYVGREVLPEVVYAYGLKDAIDKKFLKKVVLHGYVNTRTNEFVDLAIERFLAEAPELRPEGLLPKLAFFAATIEELTQDLKPAVERALLKRGISTARILVNVGDDKLTTNDDIRDFNHLDSERSHRQFILLVNKGREGWNCRSLFGVGLFRVPRSRVFVLQATMRCLRAIGEVQHTGHVFLSEDNLTILNDELQQNFRISAATLQQAGVARNRSEVQVVEPAACTQMRMPKQYSLREKQFTPGQTLNLNRHDSALWSQLIGRYRLLEKRQRGLGGADAESLDEARVVDMTGRREKRQFSRMSLITEIARYLNRSPLLIEDVLDGTREGTGEVIAAVNEYNELLYDVIIPRLFHMMFDVDETGLELTQC
jgi:type III restriction enzyme